VYVGPYERQKSMLEKAIILASAATMLGIGVIAPSLPRMPKEGRIRLKLLKELGSTTAILPG
jgi:hypothetical protein